jgi:hypothetical protein
MSDRVNHCPFLNRADSRCSNHFSLDRLESAFDHCFGQYKSCPTYGEMLAERRERHCEEGHAAAASRHVEVPSTMVYSTLSSRIEPTHVRAAYVQVRVPAGYVHSSGAL